MRQLVTHGITPVLPIAGQKFLRYFEGFLDCSLYLKISVHFFLLL
jgi:hypothetical protein